jgi:hypothetical protein
VTIHVSRNTSTPPGAPTLLKEKTFNNDIKQSSIWSKENVVDGRLAICRHRLSVNITPVERFGRVIVGSAGFVVGVILLTSAFTAVALVLELLLAAAGADLVVTGALGHCPLYAKLAHVPKSMRRSS